MAKIVLFFILCLISKISLCNTSFMTVTLSVDQFSHQIGLTADDKIVQLSMNSNIFDRNQKRIGLFELTNKEDIQLIKKLIDSLEPDYTENVESPLPHQPHVIVNKKGVPYYQEAHQQVIFVLSRILNDFDFHEKDIIRSEQRKFTHNKQPIKVSCEDKRFCDTSLGRIY
jgi:hypothetical protein